MVIVEVKEHEIDSLQQVSRQTFAETFSAVNTEENMRKYLDEAYSAEKLRVELNDPHSLFYFAKEGDAVVGYLKLNTGASQTELKDKKPLRSNGSMYWAAGRVKMWGVCSMIKP